MSIMKKERQQSHQQVSISRLGKTALTASTTTGEVSKGNSLNLKSMQQPSKNRRIQMPQSLSEKLLCIQASPLPKQ